ncbi:MAG: selenite/tellurite reduction operon porin ExtI [Mucispirillum sp.]|nr:selenite/tellurite reduction operon porin ExtI [Mucispirillum sp.]
MKKLLLIISMVSVFASSVYAFDPIELGENAYLKIFYDTQFGLTYRDTGTGVMNNEAALNLNFRRNRLGFIGTYNDVLSFYFQTEYIENKIINPLSISDTPNQNFYVLDAQVRYDPFDFLRFQLGKFKHNLTRENLEACFEPLNLDRSLFINTTFKTSRDIGVAVWGNILDGWIQYRVDVMEGKTGKSGDLFASDMSQFRYTGRLQFSFLEDKETDYGMKGTYRGNKQVLTIGGAVQYEPNVVYTDAVNLTGAKDYFAYSVDIFYEQGFENIGVFTASAAYLDINMGDAYKGEFASAESYGQNGQKRGYYVKIGYMLPNIPLQFFARYDNYYFARLDSKNQAFYNQNVSWVGAGFNYYIDGQNIKITAQYSRTMFAKQDPNDPNYRDFNTVELYTQFRF